MLAFEENTILYFRLSATNCITGVKIPLSDQKIRKTLMDTSL